MLKFEEERYMGVAKPASGGGGTPTGTISITENGTFDVASYASADVNVSGGGGSTDHGGEYSITVIDYDGTILKQDHLNSGETFTLPDVPEHTGLTFQEWSGTETITDNTVTVGTDNILIGAVYTTTSGKCEFDFDLNENTGLSVSITHLVKSSDSDAEIDWGDGTVETNPNISSSHTYTSYGTYTIKTNLVTVGSSYLTPKVTPSDASVFYYNSNLLKAIRLSSSFNPASGINYVELTYNTGFLEYVTIPKELTQKIEMRIEYTSKLKALILPTTTTSLGMNTSTFNTGDIIVRNNREFKYLIMPKNVYNSANITNFSYNYALEDITTPTSVTTLGTSSSNSSFVSNFNLERLKINGATTLTQSGFIRYCSRLKKVICGANIVKVEANAFNNETYNLRVIDFTQCTSVPQLANSNAFAPALYSNYKNDFVIKVKSSLVNQWKTATNWTVVANNIVGV